MNPEQNVLKQDQTMIMAEAQEAWFFLRRNAKLVAYITLGTVILAFVLAHVLPSRYMGEAVVMLDPRKTNVSNIESVVSSMPSENPVIRSQIDTIRSRAVIDRVIDEQKLMENPAFNPNLRGARWLMGLFTSKRKVDSDRQDAEARSVIANTLHTRLNVENDGRSFSIIIHYVDSDPDRAAAIANAFVDQYLVDQLEVKYDITRRVNEWLSTRLSELQNKVKIAEGAVEDFKTKNNLVDVGDETITQQQLSAIDEQLLEARAVRSQAQASLSAVKKMSREELETSSIVVASHLIDELKQQEAIVRRKEADLSTRYGDRHPMMIDVRNELSSIHTKINEEIRNIVAGLQNNYDIANNKVEALEKELGKLKVETSTGNQAMVTLRQLQREAASDRTLYEGFLNRFKQVAEQQDMQLPDSRVIARAEPPVKPYFPSSLIFMEVGLLAGVSIGFIVALLLEYLDRGIRFLSVAEKRYGISGLGIVPVAESKPGQMPTDYLLEKPMSVYAESIRSIRTAVHFSNVDNPPKVIVVTSTFPDEGKTVFSSSFARLLARSGQKVVLIDGDMRRPRVHSLLHLDKTKPDLAMVLAGDATLANALQKDASGADVIIASARTTNPHDLLGSRQMEKLVEELRGRYDMVVIDTPPIMTVTDAAMVGRIADATIYVARWASTAREAVGEGINRLQKYNIKLAGLVLTQVDLNDLRQYGHDDYGHYYGKYQSYYKN